MCNRSFSRIQAAKFQIRTSHSRTCTVEGRQVGDRKWQAEMMLGTVKTDKQNRNLFSSNITSIDVLNESKLLFDVFTNPHSWEPIWTYAWKGRGHIFFFLNSILHSNIKFTPSTSWVEDRGLCFKLKSISNDWPQCPEATRWQSREEQRTSRAFITVLRSLPLLKRWDIKRFLLAST